VQIYTFEPSKIEIIEQLIPKSLKTQLYKGIRDSFLLVNTELVSTASAMKAT